QRAATISPFQPSTTYHTPPAVFSKVMQGPGAPVMVAPVVVPLVTLLQVIAMALLQRSLTGACADKSAGNSNDAKIKRDALVRSDRSVISFIGLKAVIFLGSSCQWEEQCAKP